MYINQILTNDDFISFNNLSNIFFAFLPKKFFLIFIVNVFKHIKIVIFLIRVNT